MAITTVIPKKNLGGVINFDAVLSENYNLSSTVTNQPLEDGSNIQDNIINNNLGISLDCEISNTPLNKEDDGSNYSLDAYEALVDLRDKKELVDVVLGLKSFSNVIITNIDITRTKNTSNVLKFTLSLQQMTIVNSETVNIQNAKVGGDETVKNQTYTKIKVGKTTGKVNTLSEAQQQKIQNLLAGELA